MDAYKASRYSDSGAVRRTLASANWRQTDNELLEWLTREEGQYRAFAAHVLVQRQPLDTELLARIRDLRDDPQGRPWVKMAALRCLVEIERGRLARKEDAKKEQRGKAEGNETED